MSKTILLLETIADDAMHLLTSDKDLIILQGYDEPSIQKHIKEHQIDAIITRGKGQVRSELMDACPNLKVISRCGVGLDNIDVAEATKRNIKVVNAPNSNANTIAEHTISLLLMLQRNLYNAITMVKENRWTERGGYIGDELHGKTLGILGLGNIGKKVAKIADAFGMNVIYWSSKKEDVPYPFRSFDTVLSTADCISLHLPLTPKTEKLIDKDALAKMKPSALLVNTARGKIIDQEALYEALHNKKIGGFAADVLAEEPPIPNNPLLNLPNTCITAHIGSLTKTTYNHMCMLTVKNTIAILRNEKPANNCIFNQQELKK
ncbi:2-hydroxyacid dehydrogenase [Maribacter thermophilus]|uniref:2-hydroxyacid dehydrogenase n=1 Tax=Maribacter thermophilus TaxID=1197874 RepID=UPI000640E1A0|nr:NAD(P)-dependent oxidoreductase [Maribacter thermophilus]